MGDGGNVQRKCCAAAGAGGETGSTPQRYLNRLRLIKARHLLRHTDDSVTDIAYRCGFGDSNHFSTLFRREFDWSPRDIRQGRDTPLQ
jgi:AraC family L-rhamnose operon regulatory protein RhaS